MISRGWFLDKGLLLTWWQEKHQQIILFQKAFSALCPWNGFLLEGKNLIKCCYQLALGTTVSEWQKAQISSSLKTQELILSYEKSKGWQSRAGLAVSCSYQVMVFSQILGPPSLGCDSHAYRLRWLLKLWLLCYLSRQQKGKKRAKDNAPFSLKDTIQKPQVKFSFTHQWSEFSHVTILRHKGGWGI